MSEYEAPIFAEDPERTDTSGLDSPRLDGSEIDRILGEFRTWLSQPMPALPQECPEVDLATVVNGFTALRQEVNLQTKASRTQLEQMAQVVEQYKNAVAKLQVSAGSAEKEVDTAIEDALKPIFKAVLDALDALTLAHREVSKIKPPTSVPRAESMPIEPPPTIDVQIPWWARMFGLGTRIERALAPFRAWEKRNFESSPTEDVPLPTSPDPVKATLDSLLAGYSMSMNRLERILEQFGFEPIDCVGHAFDPELMEVVDVVREEGRVGSEVVGEVRRGYLRDDRVFRFAQVRVARS